MAFTHLRTWSTYYSKSGTGTPEGTSDFYGQIRVYYEQDKPNNRTRIRIDHYAYIWLAEGHSALLRNDYTMMSEYRANNGSFGGTYQRVVRKWPGAGTTYTSSQYVPLTDYTSGSYSTYHWVYHNPDGTARLYVNGKFSAFGLNDRTSSFNMDLPTIPRYATINSYNLTTASMTSLNVSWSANVTCDQVQYRIGS
ncbi:MAG TPA: hypothetical protein GX692_03280, partial [Acholeplasmataceae bacterium]|nr:hypothetical protein [Acholeplasmataceae bacterium]